jgi:hypothetical protein
MVCTEGNAGQTFGTCLPALIGALLAYTRTAPLFNPRPATSAVTAMPMSRLKF